MNKFLVFISLLTSSLGVISGCAEQPGYENSLTPGSRPGVIYGEDSVKDVPGASLNAQATVAFMDRKYSRIYERGSEFAKVGERYPVTSKLSWAKDDIFSHCSGVLISPTKVLTAGHCFDESHTCENTDIVFGFAKSPEVKKAIRKCKEIIKSYDSASEGLDYAVVLLDKEVSFNPVKFATKPVGIGQELYTLGFPLGVAMKIADGTVRRIDQSGMVVATLDVFFGNSGGPIFNSDTNELVGVLSGGEIDFELDKNNEITGLKYCTEADCNGESFTTIENIVDDLANKR